LYRAISERPRVKSWYHDERIKGIAWTVTNYAAEWIASEAESYLNAKSKISDGINKILTGAKAGFLICTVRR